MKTYARKKTIIAVAFFCISLCLPPAFAVTMSAGPRQQASETGAQPSIQVKETDYNFGEVMEGAEIEHEFTVTNIGKVSLNIERVRVD